MAKHKFTISPGIFFVVALLFTGNCFAMSRSRPIAPTEAVWSADQPSTYFYDEGDVVDSVMSGPLVLMQSVSITTGGNIEVFDFKRGTKLWGRSDYNITAVLHPHQSVKELWIVEANEFFVQLNPATGKEIQRVRILLTDREKERFVLDSKFYWLSSNLVLVSNSISQEITALSLKDGSFVWRLKQNGSAILGEIIEAPVAVGSSIFLSVFRANRSFALTANKKSGQVFGKVKEGHWIRNFQSNEVFLENDGIKGFNVKDKVLFVSEQHFLTVNRREADKVLDYRVYNRRTNKEVARLKRKSNDNSYFAGLKIYSVGNGHEALFYYDSLNSTYSMLDLVTKKKRAIVETAFPLVPIYVNWPYAFLVNGPLELFRL